MTSNSDFCDDGIFICKFSASFCYFEIDCARCIFISTVLNILDPEGHVVKDLHNENPAFLKYKFSFNDVDSGKIYLPLIFQV